jgi:hypothetical protein
MIDKYKFKPGQLFYLITQTQTVESTAPTVYVWTIEPLTVIKIGRKYIYFADCRYPIGEDNLEVRWSSTEWDNYSRLDFVFNNKEEAVAEIRRRQVLLSLTKVWQVRDFLDGLSIETLTVIKTELDAIREMSGSLIAPFFKRGWKSDTSGFS